MFPILDIAGTPRTRGRLHGQLAREQIRISVATYARLFAYCGMTWTEATRKAAGYRDVIGDVAPSLLDEIAGIAEGAGLDASEVLALNARTEILPPTYPVSPSPLRAGALAANREAALPDWGECTALAVLPSASADGKTWLAQNWDWIGAQRAALVVLRMTDEHGRRAMTLTEAGMLAKIGLNDRGFGIGLNILRSLDDGTKPGVPVHVLLRHLLDCDDVEHAITTARALSHGASSNIPIADASGHAACLELSPRGVAVIVPHDGTLAHTNHYLDATQLEHAAPLSTIASTEQRLACAERHAMQKPIRRDSLFALLRDTGDGAYSVCREPDPSLEHEVRIESIAGVAMDLVERVMWIAPDVPSRVDFSPVALDTQAISIAQPSSDTAAISPSEIDAVLFDLGGVLIDWSPRYLFSRHFPNDDAGLDHFLAEVCPSDWNVSMDAGKPLHVGIAERIALHPQHESMIRRWVDEWPLMMKGPIEGMPAVLDALKRRDLRLYALTNWSADTFPHALERFEFMKSFDDIVVSGRIRMAKPDPAIFRHTIHQCQVAPARTLFIDDSAKNIAAAASLGFRVHHFTGTDGLRERLAAFLD